MTLEEMEAIAHKAAAIKSAKARLVEAEKRLALLDDAAKQNGKDWRFSDTWNPTLLLAKGSSYTADITVTVRLPFGLVQQQLVDAVRYAKRELIALGGTP